MKVVFHTWSACEMPKPSLAVAATTVFLMITGAHAASPRNHTVAGGYADNLPVATVLRLAEHGSAKYQTYLGYMYETGRNFPQDTGWQPIGTVAPPIKGMCMRNTCLVCFMTEGRAFR